MADLIRILLSEAWPYLATVAGIIAGLFYALRSSKRQGKREAEARQTEATLKGVEDARKARSEIDALSDDAVRDRARSRMRRK